MTTRKSDFIVWIHWVRGAAAFIVLFGHWLTFLRKPAQTASAIGIDKVAVPTGNMPAQGILPQIMYAIDNVIQGNPLTDISYGATGVLLFFLVSGFLIARSVERLGARDYFIHRAFRIYPSAIAAIVIGVSVAYICYLAGFRSAMNFSIGQILSNMLLINDLLFYPYVEIGYWTLVIEIKFYIIFGFIYYGAGRAITIQNILTVAGILTAINAGFFAASNNHLEALLNFANANQLGLLFYFFRSLTDQAPMLSFMFLGSLAYFWRSGKINGFAFWGASISILVLVYASFFFSMPGNASGNISYYKDFLRAWTLFMAIYLAATFGRRPAWFSENPIFLRPLAVIGTVSYPVYLLHFLATIPVIAIVLHFTTSADLALFAGGLYLAAIAWLTHAFIETPGIRMGRALTRSAG